MNGQAQRQDDAAVAEAVSRVIAAGRRVAVTALVGTCLWALLAGRPDLAPEPDFASIWRDLVAMRASGWIAVALAILVLTPFAGVAAALVEFYRRRDVHFAFVAAVVLVLLIVAAVGPFFGMR